MIWVLRKLRNLQNIRIAMRFLFCVPLLILGVDGVRTDHHINENMFATGICVLPGDILSFTDHFRFPGVVGGFRCCDFIWHYSCGWWKIDQECQLC